MNNLTPILKTEQLTHRYSAGTPFEAVAIADVDMEIFRGEFVAIIGRTGSGKSTLMQHLNGLLLPTEGRVLFEGTDIRATKAATREVRFRVGLVFQYPEYQLFEETVYQDVAFGPKNMKLSEGEIDERVREAVAFAGVPAEVLDRSPFELSGGQKRRVAIAGVIAMRPDVLILDEPTAGLDPRGCREILWNIAEYRRKTGSAVIMVTHSMEEAARIADRLIVMDGGRIALSGAPEEVFAHGGRIRSLGLELPASMRIAERLRALGLDIAPGLHTTEQLRDAILEIRGARHA